MLELLRKYQSFIYIIVTTVIVISFSFFGTYSTIVSNPIRDQVVFTAVDGTDVKRSDLDEMVVFISTDAHDKLLFGGVWGPNFLNDGVIRKDLLATGIGQELASAYSADLEVDLIARHEKEKSYVAYVHPQAGFISAQQIWSNYAPAIKDNLDALRSASSVVEPNALNARAQLYLAHSQFPPQFLQEVLAYQEKQFSFVSHDGALDRSDLSVFGYHTLEDWFGPRFVRLTAEFIINVAKIAEEKGYEVSKEEALADLLRNAQISYEQNINNPNLGVATSSDYLNEQLRRMGMDQNQAVKLWRQVLLFRRLTHDVGNTVFVDPLLYTHFYGYAQEAVAGDIYRLPREFHFSNYRSLQKFEVYLNSISKRSDKDLLLPNTFLSEAEVARKAPQLVQKRYLLKIAAIDKNALQAKISLRDTWNWEVDHWDTLSKQFPELGVKNAVTREERFAALDSLDDQTRFRADTYARSSLVDEHPEWRQEALSKAAEKTSVIGLSSKVASTYFEGLEDGDELSKQIDKNDAVNFTADGRHYYKITVLDKSNTPDILTFTEASQQGILDAMLDRELAGYYHKNRETYETKFRKEDGSWKALEDVQNEVADLYFSNILKSIEADHGSADMKNNGNLLAPLRFYAYLKDVNALAAKDPALLSSFVSEAPAKIDETKLSERQPIADQWKLQKSAVNVHRGDGLDQSLFTLAPGSWSEVNTLANGDLSFMHVQSKGEETNRDSVATIKKLNQVQQLVAGEAQQNYMSQVINELKAKNAISLAYLNQAIETVEEPVETTEEMQ